MITEKDLQNAIAECQGERHPNANTCIKLAAYLTIYEHLYPKTQSTSDVQDIPLYEPKNDNSDRFKDYGDSDFYNMIAGKKIDDVMAVMDELMQTIQVIQPRLYDGVMNQLM